MSSSSNVENSGSVSRLNKYLALSMGISRRQADELIKQGKISVNQQLARLGQVVSETDEVYYQKEKLYLQRYQLIILNKPVGYLCSRASQGGVPTIYELLPRNLSHLKPVGRLDKDSSGLILLTNNGDFAHQMTHPSFHKSKRYLVTLDNNLQPLHQQMISDFGVNLSDGRSRLVLVRQAEGDNTRWIITMSEGRNRQIRRTFSALGYTVTKLHRTDFGNYSLGDIPRGKYEVSDIS